MANDLPLVLPSEYQATRTNVFPSIESLRWFERQHRDELIKAGAMLAPAGRKMIAPEAFDKAVLSIGSRLLAGRKRSL